jgi:hypothetical protein
MKHSTGNQKKAASRSKNIDFFGRESEFWQHVLIGSSIECWPWRLRLNTGGYGDASYAGKRMNASRVAWAVTNGEIPAGMVVCHSCDNPSCCNPSHLFVASQAENLADCRRKGRQRYRRGSHHHRAAAKLTESDVRRARELYASGIPQTHIAKIFGVHSSVICRAVRGKSWSHVS